MAKNKDDYKDTLLKRLFIDMMNTESRALLGTLLFFLTIVVFGWVAIQEPSRLGTFLDQYNGRSIARGAVLFRENCSSCHGIDAMGVVGRGPSLRYESFWDGSRAAEAGWVGSQYDYVYHTVSAGRPIVHPNYAGAMPTWSQEYGGPMRPDQVRDVVAYVMNYQLDPLPDDEVFLPYNLNEIAPEEEPVEAGQQAIDDAVAVAALEGDASNGEALFNSTQLSCMGCHSLDGSVLVGPSMQGLSERYPYEGYELPEGVEEAEGVDPFFYYLVESVWYPAEFLAPNFENLMPGDFREQMSEQDLADIIAYLQEQ